MKIFSVLLYIAACMGLVRGWGWEFIVLIIIQSIFYLRALFRTGTISMVLLLVWALFMLFAGFGVTIGVGRLAWLPPLLLAGATITAYKADLYWEDSGNSSRGYSSSSGYSSYSSYSSSHYPRCSRCGSANNIKIPIAGFEMWRCLDCDETFR